MYKTCSCIDDDNVSMCLPKHEFLQSYECKNVHLPPPSDVEVDVRGYERWGGEKKK